MRIKSVSLNPISSKAVRTSVEYFIIVSAADDLDLVSINSIQVCNLRLLLVMQSKNSVNPLDSELNAVL